MYVVKGLGYAMNKDARFFLFNIPPLSILVVGWLIFMKHLPFWAVTTIAGVGIGWALLVMVIAGRHVPPSPKKTRERHRQAWFFWVSGTAWGAWFLKRLVDGDLITIQVVGIALCLLLTFSVGWLLWSQGDSKRSA